MVSNKIYYASTSNNPYPFGSSIKSRSYSVESGFRFGFNTQEKDKEIYNNNETYTATFWEYDGRLGRRWNLDPKPMHSLSVYSVFTNNPISFRDPFGDTIIVNSNTKNKDGSEYTMFKLDDGKKNISTQSYDQFKKSGIQWYAKKEKNYANMIYLNPNLVKDNKAKGITSKEFANKIQEIRTNLRNSISYKVFGWGNISILNNFDHEEQGDIKAETNLLDGFQLTVYMNSSGEQQLIRSDLLGNFVFGFIAEENKQSFITSRSQGDFLQSEGVDDRLDTYFLFLGHDMRKKCNCVPRKFETNVLIPD